MPVALPAQISARVLQDVVTRLADPVVGFNAQLAVTVAATARYAANAQFLTSVNLVFPTDYSGASPNVLLAPLDVAEWIKSSPVPAYKALLMQIYTINVINTQQTKGLLIDGTVNIGIDCHIGWPNSKAVYDFDAPLSAVEDTIFAIFNTISPGTFTTVSPDPYQKWSQGCIWNGKLSSPMRSQVVAAGPGFMQMAHFALNVGLYIR